MLLLKAETNLINLKRRSNIFIGSGSISEIYHPFFSIYLSTLDLDNKQKNTLDNSIKKQIANKIDKLSENLYFREPLKNKAGIDLTGFYKIYVLNKKYRIVYRIVDIVEIWGIDKRDKEKSINYWQRESKKYLVCVRTQHFLVFIQFSVFFGNN